MALSGKRRATVLVFLLGFALYFPASAHAQDISICQALSTANAIYTLTANVSSSSTCFTIGANNVTLDCTGHTITYGQTSSFSNGVYIDSYNNLAVKNCTFLESGTDLTDNYAINLVNSNFSTISNNNIKTFSNLSDGIDVFSGSNNITIMNNVINVSMFESFGIFQKDSSGSNITGNSITTNNEDEPGISLRDSNSSTISNNNITSLGYLSDGVRFREGSSNNTFANNRLYVYGDQAYGMLIFESSQNNMFNLNNVTTSGQTWQYGAYIENSNNNTFLNNNITTSGSYSYGLNLYCPNASSTCIRYTNISGLDIKTTGSNSPGIYGYAISNNTFKDVTINASGYGIEFWYSSDNRFIDSRITAQAAYDLYYFYGDADWDGSYNREFFINTTFNKNNVCTNCGYTSAKIDVSWYLGAYVNDSSGTAVSNANISGWETGGSQAFTQLTSSSGYMPQQTLLEYTQDGGGKTFKTNYTVNATSGYTQTQKVNLTESKIIYFTMDTISPAITIQSPLNDTYATNSIWFNATLSEEGSWAGYSLDSAANVTMTNSTGNWNKLNSSISTGAHSVRFFANDTVGNMNASQLVYFTVTAVNTCQTLNLANTIYTMVSNVSSANTCFTIGANNVTLDGQGFWITYAQSSTGYAIANSNGYDYITLKNLNIVQNTSGILDAHAIFGYEADGFGMSYSTISNNTITLSGYYNYGISLSSGSNNNEISNNTLFLSGASSEGIFMELGSNSNTISNNEIRLSNDTAFGIVIQSSSSNNGIFNNNVTTLGTDGYGIFITSGTNNISNNNITTSGNGGHGLILEALSESNTISDNTITTSNTNAYGIYISSSSSNNIAGGSIVATRSAAYYLSGAGGTNNFTNTNFTALRNITFADSTSWFNYQKNDSSQNIWLKTNVSAASSINRTLVNWNAIVLRWNDSNSTYGLTARYNITGMSAGITYYVYNTSAGVQSNPYVLTADASGNLPSFTIALNGNTEIAVGTPTMVSAGAPNSNWAWALPYAGDKIRTGDKTNWQWAAFNNSGAGWTIPRGSAANWTWGTAN